MCEGVSWGRVAIIPLWLVLTCLTCLAIFSLTHSLTHSIASDIIMASAILFEDIFDIKQINADGKKFENGKNF